MKYEVCYEQTYSIMHVVSVDAKNQSEAIAKVDAMAHNGELLWDWDRADLDRSEVVAISKCVP